MARLRSRQVGRLDQEAVAWLLLNEERPLTDAEELDFANWRSVPGNAERYDEYLATWDMVPAAAERLSDGLDSNVVMLVPQSARAKRSRLTASNLAAIAAAVAAVILVTINLVSAVLRPTVPSYETALAEKSIVSLPDGSVVTLGPRSRLQVVFAEKERRVRLSSGEAFFEIAHDTARPFLVEAGTSIIRVVGTKFDVNIGASNVRVAVLEGVVQVHARPVGQKPTDLVLRRGQRTEVAVADIPNLGMGSSADTVKPMISAASQSPGDWRGGRLVYDNVALADLVTDLNRYYGPGVEVEDPSLGSLRITAFLRPAEIPVFVEALPGGFPVRTERGADGRFRISAPRKGE